MAETGLSIDVHVAPMRAFSGTAGEGGGDQPLWSPMSSTFIAGQRDAVLVDTLITFDQVDVLADWAERHGKRITAILITHGHSDHWIGLARLLERFPGARGLATGSVLGHARFEATDEGLQKYCRQYLRDFSRIVEEEVTVEGIVAAMLERHADRDNPRVLWYGARQAVAKRS